MPDGEVRLVPRQVGRHPHLLQPRLAPPPAQMHQEIGRGSDHIGHAGDQVAAAVAVIVHRVVEVVRRQELRLPQLAGPRADHLLGREVAAVDDTQRVQQLGTELLAAAAVVGQRRERAQDGELAHAGAVVALQRPQPGDDGARHAVVLLDLGEQLAVLLEARQAALDAVVGDELVGERQEALGEEALLAIARDHARVQRDAVESRGHRRARYALRRGLFAEAVEPDAEIAGVAAVEIGGRRYRGRARRRRLSGGLRDGRRADEAERQSQRSFAEMHELPER